MSDRRVAFFLVNNTNEYQRFVHRDAEAAARRLDVALEAFFAENDMVRQVKQMYECARRAPAERPRLMFLFPVRDASFEMAVANAAGAGIGCLFLNRRPEYRLALRKSFPALPLGSIGPDQLEIGRLQGRQAVALAPQGGLALYVMGPGLSLATAERAQGFRESLAGTSLRASEIHGDWDAALAEKAVRRWLQLVLVTEQPLRIVVCQNDAMAIGARQALSLVARERNRPALETLPVTGVDGLAEVGQKLVDERVLAATVRQLSSGGPAVEWAAAYFAGKAPAMDVILPVEPYPPMGRPAGKLAVPARISA